MNKTLLGLTLLLSAATGHAATQTYKYCTPGGGCVAGGSKTILSSSNATKYPIVLAHGLMGNGKYFDLLDYWYQIPNALAANGADVYITTVSATNGTALRGEQLLDQVQNVIALTGKAKVNLIGHSHGGPTARYVAGVAPQLVASVTTVAGVNKGSPVADVITGVTSAIGPLASDVVANIVNTFVGLIDPNDPQNSLAALSDLTTAKTAAFNQQFPGGVPATACGNGAASYQGVNYYSWSGDSSATGSITTGIDPTDAVTAIGQLTFFGTKGDGLVTSCGSHLGVVIRDDYYQNHFDEVNQAFGLVSLFTTSPVTLYTNHANRLKMAGL